MDVQQLEADAAAYIRKEFGRAMPITKTMLWEWTILTANGAHAPNIQEMGRLFFASNPFRDNPWGEHLVNLKPDPDVAKVLVVGTAGQVLSIKENVPSLLVMTGEMRNHTSLGGETVPVEPRLREVAEVYKIPVETIRVRV